jgi:hypothetical protein
MAIWDVSVGLGSCSSLNASICPSFMQFLKFSRFFYFTLLYSLSEYERTTLFTFKLHVLARSSGLNSYLFS